MYITLAIIAGILTVISVSINAQLGEKVGVAQGVLINFASGFLLISIVLALGISMNIVEFVSPKGVPVYAFFGGAVGVGVTGLCNIVLPKIPVLVASILMFVGQLVCGIIIDIVFYDTFSLGKCLGGILIAFGIYLVAKKDVAEDKNKVITS
ncbi:DMT family transporter [Oceanirhabdus seepicola]|uniref:DMT family transporter n=1 Tax=Oceanirhabdus seepicola TaxID=2828781 RepID=A0A9J6NVR5_9CLOT|nr:DMT family transporter [Oceanirhabdus seepicola]MCM1988570.1 DMT family transporter [Oceanirhabdus seepicola]